MGIFLSFCVAPNRISAAQWEGVYQEALQIVGHCDLMDRIVSERSGVRFVFARKTAERDLWERGPGILVCGTMASGYNMEYFDLFRNLEHNFSAKNVEDNGADILFDGLFTEWDPKDPDIPQPSGVYELWGDKTQGKPGHIPLLAIACLFADRFCIIKTSIRRCLRTGGWICFCSGSGSKQIASRYIERFCTRITLGWSGRSRPSGEAPAGAAG